MNLKGVIFDLDGTLVDTEEDYIYEVFQETMKCFNIYVNKEEALNFWYGQKRSELIETVYGVNSEDFWDKFVKVEDVNNRIINSYVYPDSKQVLHELKKKGLKIGLVTSAPKSISDKELELLQDFSFDSVINAHPWHGLKTKPNPDGLNKCLNDLLLNNYEVLFVGNGEEDVKAGENAGIKTLMIYRKDYQSSFDSDIKISSLNELLKESFLKELFY